jgi:cytochrome P450
MTMTATVPDRDWADYFDIFDGRYVRDPYPIWDELRGSCPVAHTDRWGGSYLPTTHADVTAVAHDVDRFSSIEITVAPVPASYDANGNRLRSIIGTDPPDHTPERRLLLPFFAPKAVERFREPTRQLCRQLVRGFVEQGEVDVAEQYAKQIPPRVIAEILGIDPARGNDFAEWVQGVLELGLQDAAVRDKYRVIIEQFFLDEIERRRVEPGDDLISYLLGAELDGAPVPMHVVRGNVSLMLIAGIDTTWSSIGAALWHLARFPDDRRRLVEEPALVPTAVEELLRAYSPVTMARIARTDTTIGDRQVGAGERVLLSFPAANRDPAVFERPDEVIIDRELNRHVAFGAGIHRCVGSNLARMEMQVAIEEFLAMIPEFELADPDAVTWAGGQVRGPRNLPIRFDRHPVDRRS